MILSESLCTIPIHCMLLLIVIYLSSITLTAFLIPLGHESIEGTSRLLSLHTFVHFGISIDTEIVLGIEVSNLLSEGITLIKSLVVELVFCLLRYCRHIHESSADIE